MTGQGLYDCRQCVEVAPEDMRRRMHCGWMPRADWPADRGLLPELVGREAYREDVCPGWLVRQPLVAECTQAWAAFDKGELATCFPDPENVLVEGVAELGRAAREYEAETMRIQRERAG